VVRQSSRPALEARHGLLHFLKRAVGRGARRDPASRVNRPERGARRTPISMLGDWSDPLPMLISHLYLMRHPRSFARAQLLGRRALREPVAL
jgi:hypothetical protein